MPSISDVILPYGNMRILAQCLSRKDLQNLALTSKAHYEYIQANHDSFTVLLKLGRCNNASQRWKRDELKYLETFMLKGRHNSLQRTFSNYLCCYLRRPRIGKDGFNPCEFEYVRAHLQAEYDEVPCEDAGGGYSNAKPCLDCGMPVCNVCRVHTDYRAAIDTDGRRVFSDYLGNDISDSEYERLCELARKRCDTGIDAVDHERGLNGGPFYVTESAMRRRGHPICRNCVPLIADPSTPEKCRCTTSVYSEKTYGDHWKCIQCYAKEGSAIYKPSKSFRKARDGPGGPDYYRCANRAKNKDCLIEMEVEDEQPFRACYWCGLKTEPIYNGVEIY